MTPLRLRALPILVLLACTLCAGCGSRLVSDGLPGGAPGSDSEVTVHRVPDGDTVSVEPEIDGEDSVRLIGVDAPEVREGQPYAAEAASFAEDRLKGRRVRLEFDAEKRDDYGRVLAYAYLPDGSMFNETLLREGLAQVATFPPNTRHLDRLEEAQDGVTAPFREFCTARMWPAVALPVGLTGVPVVNG